MHDRTPNNVAHFLRHNNTTILITPLLHLLQGTISPILRILIPTSSATDSRNITCASRTGAPPLMTGRNSWQVALPYAGR